MNFIDVAAGVANVFAAINIIDRAHTTRNQD